jgi:Zn-dependent M16 (insulinase) family peptidase
MASYNGDFDLLSGTDLPEYRGKGLRFRHRATGCEVFHVVCDDPENCFAFGFRTPSRDGSGAAHIVEHSVLCGSEAYPVKDPFLVMARRSLATYLNALTYPDRTVYPAASAVEADYFNLMSVYGDAVFFPLLDKKTFSQEGHRLQFGDDGKLAYGGVVYNEMRGAYSSADALTSAFSVESLFEKGHPYSYDSGGDPDLMPELSYEGFVDFWASQYHPANCRIFLYGNIPTERQLDFLASRFLSRHNPRWSAIKPALDGQGGPEEIARAQPWAEPKRLELRCPPEAGSDGTTSIIMNWLLPEPESAAELLAVELIGEILIGHDGSPLSVALRDSRLGDDLSPQEGLDTSFREPIFTVGLRGSGAGREEAMEKTVLAALEDFCRTGPAEDELDAAFHSIAFSNREIRRGGGTYGTRLMSRAYRTWMRGGSPELRAHIRREPHYIPGLARRILLENPHRVTLTALPDAAEAEDQDLKRAAKLALIESRLTEGERTAIQRESEELMRSQAEADPPESLARLPRLTRADIGRFIDIVPREKGRVAGAELSAHPLFTNGIVYLDLAFPLDGLSMAEFRWLPLLSRFLSNAGLPGLSYGKTAALLARYSGGFGAMLDSGTPFGGSTPPPTMTAPPAARQVSYIVFRLKALADRFPAALDLALRLLSEADLGDLGRVGDILSELGNDVISALIPSGNSFALARAGASWSPALEADDLWRGMGQFRFLKELRAACPVETCAEALGSLRASLVSRNALKVNLTAGGEDMPGALAALESGLSGLPERAAALKSPLPGSDLLPIGKSEAYAVPSQVGFVAAACPSSALGRPEYAHETVLAHLLTTGPLWDELRVKRGAYGASCYIESLEGVAFFSTYRDPRPVDSLEFFGSSLQALARKESCSEGCIEEAVVGTAGHDLKPLLPEERGLADFRRELYGIDDEVRLAKRDALLATGPKDVEAAAARLAAAFEASSSVLISRPEDVQLLGARRNGTRSIDISS